MEVQPKQIERYITLDGTIPFDDWFNSLKDGKTKYIIEKRIDRIKKGNLGDYRSVGQGVFELKVDYGPGYRLYFGQVGSTIILLLCGGDKKSQPQDIAQAINYWQSYRS